MSTGAINVYFDSDNYFQKSWSGANGKNLENGYYMSLRSFRSQVPIVWVRQGEEGAYFWVPGGPMFHGGQNNFPQDLVPAANELQSAISSVSDSIRGHNFHAGIALGTAHQTADLISQSAQKVFTAVRRVHKLDFAGACRALGISDISKGVRNLRQSDIGAFWLQIQYGWKPLLSDIHEACKAYEKSRSTAVVAVFRAQRTSKGISGTNSLGQPTRYTNTAKVKIVVRELPWPTGLGLDDPLSIVWEIVPFSFVVDWFIPIGNYLSNRSFMGSMKHEAVLTSFRKVEFDADWDVIPMGPTTEFRGGNYHMRKVELSRSVTDSLAVPLPSSKSIEKSLSLGHLQNAAALIQTNASSLSALFNRRN